MSLPSTPTVPRRRRKPDLTADERRERARIGSLSRSRSADDPDLAEARRNLRAAKVAHAITREVEHLTDEHRQQLAALLWPVAR